VQREQIPTPLAEPTRPRGRPPGPEPSVNPARPEKCLIRARDVCSRIRVSRSGLYRMIQLGTFPPPKRLGGRTIAWLESDVDDWIDSKTTRRVCDLR
jgi:prophage regulatory protein